MGLKFKYEHLTVFLGDQVRITVTHRDTGLPFTAEGPVLSSFGEYVYEKGTTLSNIIPSSNIIGYEPSGIEMTDKRTNKYRYWKSVDGGIVEKLIKDKYHQVYPIQFEGVTTKDMRNNQ